MASQASEKVVCVDSNVMDGAFSASFSGLLSGMPQVKLYIPSGETSGKTKSGKCFEDRNSYGTAFTCLVKETLTTGYLVKLSSGDNLKSTSTVSDWKFEDNNSSFTVDLPCQK